jgi:hypothetical protein
MLLQAQQTFMICQSQLQMVRPDIPRARFGVERDGNLLAEECLRPVRTSRTVIKFTVQMLRDLGWERRSDQ